MSNLDEVEVMTPEQARARLEEICCELRQKLDAAAPKPGSFSADSKEDQPRPISAGVQSGAFGSRAALRVSDWFLTASMVVGGIAAACCVLLFWLVAQAVNAIVILASILIALGLLAWSGLNRAGSWCRGVGNG